MVGHLRTASGKGAAANFVIGWEQKTHEVILYALKVTLEFIEENKQARGFNCASLPAW